MIKRKHGLCIRIKMKGNLIQEKPTSRLNKNCSWFKPIAIEQLIKIIPTVAADKSPKSHREQTIDITSLLRWRRLIHILFLSKYILKLVLSPLTLLRLILKPLSLLLLLIHLVLILPLVSFPKFLNPLLQAGFRRRHCSSEKEYK